MTVVVVTVVVIVLMELIDDEFSEKGIKEEDIDDDGLIFEEVILDPFGWRGIGS